MKPQRLTLQAFGPFWNRTEVDFLPAHPQGLFLIHGPVGSGKTTLLDALCYALYGVSSGGERSPHQLRCDLAPDHLVTEVCLDFCSSGQNWSVKRTPEHLSLHRAGQLEHTGPTAETKIQEILGLDAFQFRRSVLLPQGQFRQFLLAEAEEREQILAALLHTHSPKLFQQALQAALEECEGELRTAWQRRENSAVEQELRQTQDTQNQLHQQLQFWLEHQQRWLDNRERAVLVSERSRERMRVRGELAQLRERESDLAELQKLATQLRAAQELERWVRQWEQAQEDERLAEENCRAAELELEQRMTALRPPEEAAHQLEALRQRSQEIQHQLAELDRHESQLKRLELAEQGLLKCRSTWNQLQEEGQLMNRELVAAQSRQSDNQRLGQEEENLRSQVLARQKELEELREAAKQQRLLDELAAGIERVHQQLAKIGQRRERILQHIEGLERQVEERSRLLEQHWAFALAQQLKPGLACSVCGSLEHPSPAQPGGSPVQVSLEQLRKQLDLAWKQAEQIENEEQEQQIHLVRLEERQQAALQRPISSLDSSQIQVVTAALRDLERELSRLAHYRDHEERDRKRVRKLKRRLEGWEEARSVALQALSQAEAIVSERRSSLPDELRDMAEIGRRRQHLQNQLEPLQSQTESFQMALGQDTHLYASFQAAAKAARKSIELSQERTRLAWDVVQSRMALHQIESLAMWRKLFNQAQQDLLSIEQEIQSHQLRCQQLEKESERAESLYHESLEDWREAEIDPEQLDAKIQEIRAQLAEVEARLIRLRQQAHDYERAFLEIQRLEPRRANLRRLSGSAQGDNPKQISYQQWVLSRQMGQVLHSANQRLAHMTGGRYTLENGNAALQLQVLDHLSGQPRAATTLSGGESFLASLALALGLSDRFLQSGARLDTLFIDEGFGYLDEEGLDQALWALERVEQGQRLVGVVSHLAELRQRIPRRLEIRQSASGNQFHWKVD